FRKAFTTKTPESAIVALAADDAFELYLNGRRIGTGESTKRLVEFDISKLVVKGNNLLAVKVTNRNGKTSALVARVTVKEKNGEWTSHSSDDTWRATTTSLPLWNTAVYNDRNWSNAQVFGTLGETAPWDRRDEVAADAPAEGEEQPAPIVNANTVGRPRPGSSAKTADTATDNPKPVNTGATPPGEFKEPV